MDKPISRDHYARACAVARAFAAAATSNTATAGAYRSAAATAATACAAAHQAGHNSAATEWAAVAGTFDALAERADVPLRYAERRAIAVAFAAECAATAAKLAAAADASADASARGLAGDACDVVVVAFFVADE